MIVHSNGKMKKNVFFGDSKIILSFYGIANKRKVNTDKRRKGESDIKTQRVFKYNKQKVTESMSSRVFEYSTD